VYRLQLPVLDGEIQQRSCHKVHISFCSNELFHYVQTILLNGGIERISPPENSFARIRIGVASIMILTISLLA
jgi:hypothetical protein